MYIWIYQYYLNVAGLVNRQQLELLCGCSSFWDETRQLATGNQDVRVRCIRSCNTVTVENRDKQIGETSWIAVNGWFKGC